MSKRNPQEIEMYTQILHQDWDDSELRATRRMFIKRGLNQVEDCPRQQPSHASRYSAKSCSRSRRVSAGRSWPTPNAASAEADSR